MVMGCSGGGKSSLSKKIAKITGLRLIHMDFFYFEPNWIMRDNDMIMQDVLSAIKHDGWVFDGNHSSTQDARAEKSQMIIWVDIPRWRCLLNVVMRTWKYRGRARPDMADGCNERLTWDFIKFIWGFKHRGNVKIAKLIEDHQMAKFTFRLKSYAEVNALVARFENGDFNV